MDEFGMNLDRQLGDWLRDESSTKAPGRVIEGVFAQTTRSNQVRRWWPPVFAPRPMEAGLSLRAVAAVIAVVAVASFAVVRFLPIPGVGVLPTPTPSSRPSPTPLAPLPSPEATTLDGAAALHVRLGADAGPIDVVGAFGDVWTANIHSNDVSRLNAATLEQLARAPAGTGPAWFAATGNGLWATNQLGGGLTLIDPATNTSVVTVGDAQPCGAPVVAFGALWASACDDHEILRIELASFADLDAARRLPTTGEFLTKIPALGYKWLALINGRLVTTSVTSVAEIDPATNAITDLGICCGSVMGADDQAVWLNAGSAIDRIALDGTTLGTIPYPGDQAIVTFASGHAWLAVGGVGVVEIDLATNAVLRTIPVPGSTLVAREIDGVLWVTSFDTSDIWRIQL